MQMTLSRSPAHLARRTLALIFTVAACAFMIHSAYSFQVDYTTIFYIPQAVFSFVLGIIAFGAALWVADLKPQTLRPTTAIESARIRWLLVIPGVVLLVAVGEISGELERVPFLIRVNPHVQFGLLLAGVLLVGFGFAGRITIDRVTDKWTALLLGLIILIGLGVRVWGLDTTARFMMDETIFTDAMMPYQVGSPHGLMNGGGKITLTMVYPYWNAWTVALFGANLVGLRMTSALIGALTIPVVFGLGSALFDRRLGLLAALLAATFPPHVQFSRIAIGQVGDALFGVMMLMFIARGLRWNRRPDWAFAGVSLGMTQYFYEAGRFLFPALFLGWIVLLAIGWDIRRFWRGIVVCALAGALVALPVYYAVSLHGSDFSPRFNEMGRISYLLSLFEDGLTPEEEHQIRSALTLPLLVYTYQHDLLLEHYGGRGGMVSPPLIPLLLLGAAWLIWRIRYPAFVLLLALIGASVGNMLVADGAQYARFVVIMPIVPIVMAVGLYETLRLFNLLQSRALLIGLGVVAAAWQIYFLFGIHLPFYNEQRRYHMGGRDYFDSVLLTPELPPNTEMYILDPVEVIDYGRAARLRDFVAGMPITQPMYPLQAPSLSTFDPALLPRDRNYAFFVAPGDRVTQLKILAAFPDIQPPRYSQYPIPAWDEYVLLYWEMIP
jgi:4-amino-4-deoxy-L-arabinose transferase-like glycosyltransferase